MPILHRHLLTSWLSGLVDELAHRRARRRFRDELDALGPDYRERVLADCGLSPDHLSAMLAREPETKDLLHRLMAAIDLERGRTPGLDAATVRDLEITCTSCRNWQHCRKALADGSAATTYATFCPNAETFKALAGGRRAS